MTTKFRVGDVVGWFPEEEGRQLGADLLVTGVDVCGYALCRDVDYPADHPGPMNPERLRLLRRPVQVGDVLMVAGSTLTFPAEADVLAAGRYRSPAFVHADGTPIDPPQAATQGAGTMAAEGPQPARDPRLITRDDDDVFALRVDGLGDIRIDGRLMWQWKYAPRAESIMEVLAHEASVLARELPKPPTAEQLARALFETDPRVVAFVTRRSETTSADGDPVVTRVRDVAWTRDEGGWATEARERAEQILDALRRRS